MLSKLINFTKAVLVGITEGRAQASLASKKYYGVHYN